MRTAPPAKHPTSIDDLPPWIPAAVIVLLTLLAYSAVWSAGFIWDDDSYVFQNSTLHDFHGLFRIWFEIGAVPQYYPLVHTTFWLEYHLWGLHPAGYHVDNVLLHALAATLLGLLLRQLRLPGAWLVAALFALHPVNVESVAWVTERKDVLCGLFFMLTLWAYLGYVRHPFSWARYALLLLLFALGLMAKPMLVTLPFVLLLLDYWPLERMAGRADQRPLSPWRLMIEKLPLFALVAGDCVVMMLIQEHTLVSSERLPLWWRLGNAAITYVAYLGQFF